MAKIHYELKANILLCGENRFSKGQGVTNHKGSVTCKKCLYALKNKI